MKCQFRALAVSDTLFNFTDDIVDPFTERDVSSFLALRLLRSFVGLKKAVVFRKWQRLEN